MGGTHSSPGSTKDAARKSEKASALQNQIKEKFVNIAQEGFPWLDQPTRTIKEGYVELSLSGRDKLGKKVDQFKLEDLFKDDENQKMSRILIEGSNGYGKTTILAKLAFDWACNKSYIDQFDCVLLLSLRDCKGDLEEIISQAAGITLEEYKDYFMELLQSNSINTLVLIDGFDEASSETVSTIMPLIHNESYNCITLVITAKPGARILHQRESECNLSKVIHKYITIEGFKPAQQLEFLRTRIAEDIDAELIMMFIKENQVIPIQFFESPLLIHIFTTCVWPALGSLRNSTDTYRLVFNIAFRRYFSKLNESISSNFDIFAIDEGEMFEPVQLMTNFGRVALNAISEKKDQVMHKELQQDFDYRFIELGFLKQGIIMNGITESVTYVPIHKTIWEFGAAYYLWISSASNSCNNWENLVTNFRPDRYNANPFSLFPFLAGLMGERATLLYNVLAPYSSEYSYWFGSLGFSLLSTKMTAEILESLSPLLPVEWRAPAYKYDKGFCQSPLHRTILSYALNKGIVKQIRWMPSCAVSYPDNLKVDTIIVPVITPLAPLDKSNINGITCQELRFNFSFFTFPTEGDMPILLGIINAVQYQHICFNFALGCPSEWLQYIHSAAMNGLLKNTSIKLMKCFLSNQLDQQLNLLSELIMNEKLEGVDVILYIQFLPSSASNLNPWDDLASATVQQEQIDMLVALAAKSTRLKRFTLINQLFNTHLTVDLSLLCDGGHKTWEWVQLEFVEVQCSTETIEQPLEVQYLSFSSADVNEVTRLNIFHHCRTKSLSCESILLTDTNQTWPLHESLTELRVRFQKSVYHHGLFFFLPSDLPNLQTLALTMASPKTIGKSLHTALENILLPSEKSLTLKGLEVWEIEENPELALELIIEVIRCLEGRQAANFSGGSKSLKVEYLMLHTQAHPDPPSSFENRDMTLDEIHLEEVMSFISLASVLKRPLMDQTLPRLDIICLEELLYYMSIVQPGGVSSWIEAFPADEGFSIKEEVLGLNLDDHVQSRGLQDKLSLSTFKKLSITCNTH